MERILQQVRLLQEMILEQAGSLPRGERLLRLAVLADATDVYVNSLVDAGAGLQAIQNMLLDGAQLAQLIAQRHQVQNAAGC